MGNNTWSMSAINNGPQHTLTQAFSVVVVILSHNCNRTQITRCRRDGTLGLEVTFLWLTKSPLSPRAQAVYTRSSHRGPVTLPWSLPLSWWILASGHFCHRSRWWLWLCLSIRHPILPYLEPQWSVHTWDFPRSTQQRNTREDRV